MDLGLYPAQILSGVMPGSRWGNHHEESHCRIHRNVCLGSFGLRHSGYRRDGQRRDLSRYSRHRDGVRARHRRMATASARSGLHINPAVSFGVLVARRMTVSDFITYVIAQVLGAIAGAVVLYLILSGKASGWSGSLGQNGWGPGYLGEYNTTSAFIYEMAATFLFLVCILGVTQRGAPVELAGIAMGLTLIAIHLLGINVTGTSVNPARSLGPALVGYAKNPHALEQVWLFIIAPLIGAGIAGYLFKARILSGEDVIPERGGAKSDVPPAASAPRKRP